MSPRRACDKGEWEGGAGEYPAPQLPGDPRPLPRPRLLQLLLHQLGLGGLEGLHQDVADQARPLLVEGGDGGGVRGARLQLLDDHVRLRGGGMEVDFKGTVAWDGFLANSFYSSFLFK